MKVRHLHRWIVLLTVALLGVASCISQPSGERTEVDLSEPHDYGTYDGGGEEGGQEAARRPDADTEDAEEQIPEARVEPASNYPWLPQDRPIRFHTLEESEATRDKWQPLLDSEDAEDREDRKLAERALRVRFLYPRDKNLEHLAPIAAPDEFYRQRPPHVSPGEQRVRGRFGGLGEPFVDDYLHFFEVPGIYVIGDYMVHASLAGLMVHFIKDPNSPADPAKVETIEQLQLPEPFWSWFAEVARKSQSLDEEPVRLDVYLYFQFDDAHSVSERTVHWVYPHAYGAPPSPPGQFRSAIPSEHQSDR